jgi:hypothetical protein
MEENKLVAEMSGKIMLSSAGILPPQKLFNSHFV